MKKLILIGFLSLISSLSHASGGFDSPHANGFTIYHGYTSADIGSGTNTEIGIWMMAGGGSLSHKRLGDKEISGGSLGIGFTPLAQAHLGYSNEGAFFKLKSEFCPFGGQSIAYAAGRDEAPAFATERICVNLSYENYGESDKDLNNLGIGLGWVFN